MSLVYRPPAPRKTAVALITTTTGLLLAACANTEFYVNPTLRPSPTASPELTPTVKVTRAVPTRAVWNEQTPESGVRPTPISLRVQPTPLPQFRFLVTPTPGPPVILANGVVLPPGSRPLGGSPRLEDLPESNLMEAFERIVWQEGVSVKSRFYWPVVSDTGDQVGEVLVEVEGEYRLTVTDDGDISESAFLLNNASDFHLFFSQELPGTATPVESEIKATRTRLVNDTLGTGLNTYSSLEAWRDDADREMAAMAMFLSLALTGGRLVSDDFAEWLKFERGRVDEMTTVGLYSRRDSMFTASRVNENGDREEWQFWLDFYERPERIELTITSEDPARNLRGAVLEITYSGEVLEPAGMPGE